MKLYHFSDRGDIEEFVPRAPLRHPDSEPLVYAMHENWSPLYLFPRDCPRIATWVTGETSFRDRNEFFSRGPEWMKAFIDRSYAEAWRNGMVYRYLFDEDGFDDCRGYGDWVSRAPQRPLAVDKIDDLPGAAAAHGMLVEVVDSLVELGHELHDFEAKEWTTTLHVSMVRMGLLPGWEHTASKPAWKPQ